MKNNLIAVLTLLIFFSLGGISTAAVEIRINAGGSDYTAVSGDLFVVDKAYVAGDFGYTDGRSFSFPEDIAGTTDDPIYQTIRASRSFSYLFDNLPEGEYEVTLYFMEPWQSQSGERAFDVTVEGQLVLDDYDIVAEAGGQFTAVTETIVTQVTDGQLNIDFIQVNRVPIVSAIGVVSSGGTDPVPDIGVNPISLDYGDVVVGTSSEMDVTLNNEGTADLEVTDLSISSGEFTVLSPTTPVTLTPGGTQAVTVQFSPTATGAASGSLDISSDDPDEGVVTVFLSGNGIELIPDISISPTSLDYGDVVVDTTSEMDVTLSNDGTADLEVTDLSISSGEFTVLSPATPVTLTPGGTQVVTVQFSPTATGVASGSLDITSDDPDEGVVNVSLSGNGIDAPPDEPDISVNVSSLDFGQVVVGSSADQMLTITNDGTQLLSVTDLSTTNGVFTIVDPAVPFDVSANGGSQVVTVRFSPNAEGTVSGDLQISSNDPDEGVLTVALVGNGITTPQVELRINAGGVDYTDTNGHLFVADKAYVADDFGYTDGRSFSFPEDIAGTTDDLLYQTVRASLSFSYLFDNLPEGEYQVTLYFMEPWQSQSGERAFDVTIEGQLVLDEYDIIAEAGGQYTAVTETIVTQVSDGQLNIDFLFSHRAALVSAIEIVSTGDVTPEADISVVPTGLDFGDVVVEESSNLNVSITNDGTADLEVSDLSSTNGVFSVDSPTTPFTLGPGSSQVVTVQFSPPETGTQNGELHITSDDPNEGSIIVSLSGNGIEFIPDISVTPLSLDYGDVVVGMSGEMDVTISNDGAADLEVTGLSNTNEAFTMVSPPATPFTLIPGGTQVVTVHFSPAATGAVNDSLDISSDDPDEGLVTVSLNGNGIDAPPDEPDISVNVTSLAFGQVPVGSSAGQTVTITNDGTQPLNVSSLITTQADFTAVSPATPFGVAANGGSQVVTVRFSPSAEGAVTGDLQIASNDPDQGLVTVTLSGEGVSTPAIEFRINAGGDDYTDTHGDLFVADKVHEDGDFGYFGGQTLTTQANIDGTVDDALYQSMRSGNNFSYLFDNLPDGEYEITLHFVEPVLNGAGLRLFDVTVEGVTALDDYDIYAAAGGKLIAVTEPVSVNVADGQLNIDFIGVVRKPFISAISVVSANSVQPVPDISVAPAIKILPLGDSITFGTYGDGDTRPEAEVTGYRQPLYLSLTAAGHYVDFVGSLQSGNLAVPSFDYDHEGHSGQTDNWIADRVYGFLDSNPADVVLLHIGTNSLDPSPTDVEQILNEIDRYEADANTDVTVILARIINRQTYSQMTTDFNDNVEAMALNRIANGDKIIIVDQEGALVYPDDLADNLHPNDNGYAKMATVWFNALDDFLANVDFGNVAVASSSDLDITLSNNGTADLEITGFTMSNPSFSVVLPSTPFSIPPGDSQQVTLRFSPTITGTQTGTLDITSNDPDTGLVTISIHGNGLEEASGASN